MGYISILPRDTNSSNPVGNDENVIDIFVVRPRYQLSVLGDTNHSNYWSRTG